jgi:hypothetical protein
LILLVLLIFEMEEMALMMMRKLGKDNGGGVGHRWTL